MDFSVTSCYAAMLCNISKDVDEAFCRMIIALIDKMNYTTIELHDIIKDFKDEFDFELSYFPMQRILSKLCENGVISCNRQQKYCVNRDKLTGASSFWSSLSDQERNYNELARQFMVYNNEIFADSPISLDDSKKIIDSFVEENGISFLSNRDTGKALSSSENYRFCLFLEFASTSQPDLYSFVDSTIIGRILSETIAFDAERASEYKSNGKIYLDTSIVFYLLGIGSSDKSEYYKSLLQDMRTLGFHPCIFNHTYTEIVTLLENSAQWIGNLDYDPSKASETAYYFVTNNWTKERVQLFIANFPQKLREFHIQIIQNFDYPQRLPIGMLTEMSYYQKIVDYYRETNPHFSETEKQDTVEFDAKSFFYTEYRNHGEPPRSFSDIENLFVTSNKSLARIAQKITSTRTGVSNQSLPFCVTDYIWGNLVWANSPTPLNSSSKFRLNSIVAAAFEPSNALLVKLKNALNKLEDSEQITPETCYMLKSNAMSMELLMRFTQGDDNRFTDKTPLDILKALQTDSKNEGIAEEKARQELLAINTQKAHRRTLLSEKELRLQDLKAEESHFIESIHSINTVLSDYQNQFNQAQKRRENAVPECKIKIRFSYFIATIPLILGYVIGLFFSLAFKGVYFNTLTWGLEGIGLFFYSLFVRGKYENISSPKDFPNIYPQIKQKVLEQYYSIHNCTEQEISKLEEKLSQQNELLVTTQSNLDINSKHQKELSDEITHLKAE